MIKAINSTPSPVPSLEYVAQNKGSVIETLSLTTNQATEEVEPKARPNKSTNKTPKLSRKGHWKF